MNRIKNTLEKYSSPSGRACPDVISGLGGALNVYLTAGFPKLNDTIEIVQELEKNGVDMVEIGMPFSDPLADGPTIQNSSEIAIKNGITLELIFQQIEEIRKTVTIPIILMGYYNQLLQFGVEDFVKKATNVGVDGLIIPDLPLDIYQKEYQALLEQYNLKMSFLITPQTTEERVLEIAKESTAFLYVVSSYAITGGKSGIEDYQTEYFKKVAGLSIQTPKLIGFGISNRETFEKACQYVEGAIIGSAFIKAIGKSENIKTTIKEFVESIK
ncbi:MAG: tryptophan synthase subunit alpha [Flavobacteriales bacterium]|nr:tryptophan synthase subunit alpha [Flavobacteriales bacterium]MCB9363784.1 tryptophan synthase subunit alpha [Flavobacteriales bacterium]